MGSIKEKRFDVKFLEQNSTFNIGGGGSGTTNYEKLRNKPSINGVELYGDKTGEELGLVNGNDFASATDALSFEDSRLCGSLISSLAAVTKRVEGGTKLCNQFHIDAGAVQLGFGYLATENKLRIYAVYTYAFDNKSVDHVEYYALSDKNTTAEQVELTFDTAPSKSRITHGAKESLHKARLNVSGPFSIDAHTDIRLFARIYGTDGTIIDEFYSSQYSYTIANGVVTRTRFKETAPQDPRFIIDIGLYHENDSTMSTFGHIMATDVDYLPLVSDPNATAQYEYIIPDSMFTDQYGLSVAVRRGDGVSHIGPTFFKAEIPFDPGELNPLREDIDLNTGSMVALPVAVTEYVAGGTKLCNQLRVLKGCVFIGYCYDQTENALYNYGFFAYSSVKADHIMHYYLTEKGSQNAAYEFTLSNAPKISIVGSGNEFYKWRIKSSNIVGNTNYDMRLCTVAYDENDNEIERIYSDQFRYTLVGNTMTRTRVATSAGAGDVVTDVGLTVYDDSVLTTFSYVRGNYTLDLLPLVSTVQSTQYEFIIPDDMFTGEYGLTLTVRMADRTTYFGPTFKKAEAPRPTLPPGGNTNDVLVKLSSNDYDAVWAPIG